MSFKNAFATFFFRSITIAIVGPTVTAVVNAHTCLTIPKLKNISSRMLKSFKLKISLMTSSRPALDLSLTHIYYLREFGVTKNATLLLAGQRKLGLKESNAE